MHSPRASAPLGRADLHLHTTASDGLVTPAQLLDRAEALALDVIAVTDHDTVAGAHAVRELAAKRNSRVEVIAGIEVTVTKGMHVLGLFVEDPIKTHQPVGYTIEAILAQGGIPLAPHPLSPLTLSLGRRTIEGLLQKGYPLAGVETANPTPAGKITRRQVLEHNRKWGLAEFGGSDAHFLQHVGTGFTTFPGRTAADVRRALLACTTAGHFTSARIPFVHPFDYARQLHKSMIQAPARKLAQSVAGRRLSPAV
jgi:predicted metal-dependent phosphoesterase TrpH